jgi:hypothetical protein
MSSQLELLRRPKRYFDENNKRDIDIYRQFLVKGGWGQNCCPFVLEEPHISIPDMIKDKLIKKFLKV